MHSKLLKFSLSLTLAGVFQAPQAHSQELEAVEAQAPLSPVEDTTLDSSNGAAADAVNAVPETPKESTQVEGSASDASAVSSESPTVEPTPPAVPEQRPDATTTDEVDTNKEAQSAEETKSSEQEQPSTESTASEVTSTQQVEESTAKANSGVKGIYGGRVFGRYRIQIAGNRPMFNEGQKCYDKLYGKAQTYYSMSADWFPLDWWINPGITMRVGSYSARGKAASGVVEGSKITSCDQLTVDSNSKTTLLFMPLQLGAKIQITPFSRKWLVVDVWGSGEYGWWQETRDSASSFDSPLRFSAIADADTNNSKTYTNTGRKPAVSTGASVHLLLNYLDEQTVRSMVDSMGLGYVYLSGFAEQVKSRTVTGLSFGRQVVGVGFTFETFK